MTETVKPSLNKKLAAYFSVIGLCLALGYWAAYEQAQIPSGYLASYSFLAYLFFGGILILTALISGVGLLFSPQTRWLGPPVLIVCALLPAGYLGSLKTLSLLGKVRYEREDRMIEMGSDMPKGLVIVFKKDTGRERIERFNREILSKPHPEGKGYYSADGMCLFTRPPGVQGYDVVEIRFCQNATDEQRTQLKANVLASPLVYKVIDDVKPSEIKNID